MDNIVIDGEPYVIMRRSEYVDRCQAFIDDGIQREQLSREMDDAVIMGVLKFYAFDDNYLPDISEVTGVEPGTGLMQRDLANVVADNGKKARDAIKVLELRNEGEKEKDDE